MTGNLPCAGKPLTCPVGRVLQYTTNYKWHILAVSSDCRVLGNQTQVFVLLMSSNVTINQPRLMSDDLQLVIMTTQTNICYAS